MLCAQAWKPGSQHAGEKRGVAGLLLGRTASFQTAKDYSNETSVKVREAYADGFLAGALPQSISTHGKNLAPFATTFIQEPGAAPGTRHTLTA